MTQYDESAATIGQIDLVTALEHKSCELACARRRILMDLDSFFQIGRDFDRIFRSIGDFCHARNEVAARQQISLEELLVWWRVRQSLYDLASLFFELESHRNTKSWWRSRLRTALHCRLSFSLAIELDQQQYRILRL